MVRECSESAMKSKFYLLFVLRVVIIREFQMLSAFLKC